MDRGDRGEAEREVWVDRGDWWELSERYGWIVVTGGKLSERYG